MTTKNFIVPHDFSEVANIALEHAIVTAKQLNAEINVLHIVKSAKYVREAHKKLNEVIAAFNTSVKIIPHVRIGDIFEDIGDFSAEEDAELIFMGTHGTKGWQHITGNRALKVVNSSSAPFIIVQELSPKETGYNDIVVPLDLNNETKQKLAIVAELAKYFDSKIHVVTPRETDEYLKDQINVNITFANRYFSERDIDFTTTLIPSNNFAQQVIKHAASVNADLIAFMNLNQNNIFGVITANYEEALLNNEEKIPTLVMNPIKGISFTTYNFTESL